MTHMQWAGRVGGDKLHLYPARLTLSIMALLVVAVTFCLLLYLLNHGLTCRRAKEEVDKASTSDFYLGDIFRSGQRIYQRLRDRARILAQWLGQHHGQVGGKISVLGGLGALQLDGDRIGSEAVCRLLE